jgi:alkaline phosphatase
MRPGLVVAALSALLPLASAVHAATTLRIMPPDGATIAAGQKFDLRVEATGDGVEPPRGLEVQLDGRDLTAGNVLEAGRGGEKGAGGTGTPAGFAGRRASAAAARTTNFLLRDLVLDTPGRHVIRARTADGATLEATVQVDAWAQPRVGARPARNVILLLGDGMGAAVRTAARVVAKGQHWGKARAPLAMDTMAVTGLSITSSLNATITDSAPGMSSLSTGHKANNNQEGVYPDNTPDAFDNPRVEYIGELLRRTRGAGFNVGLVTTADVTDATPAANAVHTANRDARFEIAVRYFEERGSNGVSVLMGGGSSNFFPDGAGGQRRDGRALASEFQAQGFDLVRTRGEVTTRLGGAAPKAVLGLFHPRHMSVAFDKAGAGTYSKELALERNAALRDQPMLDEMTRLALHSLAAHSPKGFYLMVEGASIDKQEHEQDADRVIWDAIEFDHAVQVALDFAARTNADTDPANDTLVVVTADHESGGFATIGVGNERYAPGVIGRATRDYAATLRFLPEQELNLFTNYTVGPDGFPTDPDPTRKLLIGFAAGADRYENWLSNRLAQVGTVVLQGTTVAVANPRRDGPGPEADNASVAGDAMPGFLVAGTIENGATGCPTPGGCPADTAAAAAAIAGHTAADVPLSAQGPGQWQFTGTYENTSVFLKMLRAAAGSYPRLDQ